MVKLMGKAKLKSLEEVYNDSRTDFVREGDKVVAIVNMRSNDFIYSYEFPILGNVACIYSDDSEDTYDLMPEGMEYSDDSSEALYVMTVDGLKWIVDGEVEWF